MSVGTVAVHGDNYLDAVLEVVATVGAARTLGAVAVAVVREICDPEWSCQEQLTNVLSSVGAIDESLVAAVRPPRALARAGLLGTIHGSLVGADHRKRHGVHYTPTEVAAGLTRLALVGRTTTESVCDPAVGGGVFLVAAAEELRSAGGHPTDIVARRLFGADIDPLAVAVSRVELGLWAATWTGRVELPPESAVVCANSLLGGSDVWPAAPKAGFDVIVGNPPFRSQLRDRTVRDASDAGAVGTRLGLGSLGYADDAALFLATACGMCRPGGTVALILPQSMLTARDARSARAYVAQRARVVAAWIGDDVGFEASVRVWAPVLEVCATSGNDHTDRQVPRYVGSAFVARPPAQSTSLFTSTWSPLVADLLGGIDLDVDRELKTDDRTLAALATATAGFREQFYGLAPYVIELPAGSFDSTRYAPLITTGLLDPFHDRWGHHPIRFAKKRWHTPVVDLIALREGNEKLDGWVSQRLVPKVLVAPQAKILEVLADPDGRLVPSTPVVSVEVRRDSTCSVWHIAALVSSPAIAAWAFRQSAGSGLGASTIRVPARVLLDVPLPRGSSHWDDAAHLGLLASRAAVHGDGDGWAAALDEMGAVMNMAFGLDAAHPVLRWWQSRRPAWRG